MEVSSTNYKIRSLRKELLAFCLLCAWAMQMVSPQASGVDFIQRAICNGIPGLNERQIEICINVPKSMNVLTDAQRIFESECVWQFRKEKWSCTGVNMSIFSAPTLSETKESAFVYALTSALAVHQITTACSDELLGAECGCDTSRNGGKTPAGWIWGGCSANISYGLFFAQRFLDSRELNESTDEERDNAISQVHLHNNGAGRRVVADGMDRACKCHGFSGSCSIQTCWNELPTIYKIGDDIKQLYDKAKEVELYQPTSGPSFLRYMEDGEYIIPSTADMVYLDESPRYCAASSNFTSQRQCMPQSALNGSEFSNTDMKEHYPPCETFCCNGGYQTYHKTEVTSCNCNFVWCCEVVCQTCTTNVTEYRCTG